MLGAIHLLQAGEALLARMNTALESMFKDCTYTRIREKYLKVAVLAAEAHCVKPQ